MTAVAGGLMVLTAMLLLGGAYMLYVSSRKAKFREKVHVHFEQILPRSNSVSWLGPDSPENSWYKFKIQASIYAGFDLKGWHFIVIPFLFLLIGLLGWYWMRWTGAFLSFGSSVFLFGFLLPYSRLHKRQAITIAQIPMFIDQVLRSLGTGRSVESAVRIAAAEAPVPLKHVLDRVIREADLGADMTGSLSEAAALHRLKELNLIALAMSISNSYGSSPKEMLQSIVHMIRQRELAHRELTAMTGETRVSAWVLGLTPVSLAIYMAVVNPGYLETMLQDPSGQMIFQSALGLQGVGTFLLWRMLRSVG